MRKQVRAHYQRNTVVVPTDLDAITRRDPREEAADAHRAERIWALVEDLYRTGYQPGIGLCIRHRGRIVLNRTLGHARGLTPGNPDLSAAVPLELDTPMSLFSSSKAITAVLVHKLAEEGRIRLDAPVCDYIPEFAAHGKHHTTVEQVLAHQAGIPSFPTEFTIDHAGEWDAVIDVLCRMPPISKAGRLTAYHAITGGFILGEVAQRATGQSLADILDTRIRQPLGMGGFTFGVAPEDNARVAQNYFVGPPLPRPLASLAEKALGIGFEEACELSNQPMFLNNVVPAGNLHATAEEASRAFQMLLDGGQFEGRQVLKPETVLQAAMPFGRMRFDRLLRLPMRYSRGMMLGHPMVSLYGPKNALAFGHLGFLNILCWADPERALAVSLITTGKAALGPHLGPLSRTMAAINTLFPPSESLIPEWAQALPRGLKAMI
ncbi:MAG: serine hydrolase domain-containing protein [Oceanococcaceae bacterium]